MWIFMSNSYLSIVQYGGDYNKLLVRARFPRDIKRVFPEAYVKRSPDADYLYRAVIDRELVAKVIAQQVTAIEYPNFKGSLSATDEIRTAAYHDVWAAMLRAQTAEARRNAADRRLAGNRETVPGD